MEVTYTFKNGTIVKGTVEQILAVANILKETVDLSKLPREPGYYKSASKGLVKISQMNDIHLKNALCKSIKNFYEKLAAAPYTDLATFEAMSTSLAADPVVSDLYKEVTARVRRLVK